MGGIWLVSEMKYSRIWSAYDAGSSRLPLACDTLSISVSPSWGRAFRLRGLRDCGGEGDLKPSSNPEAAGLLRMGDGVRELEDASEGEGVIEPSSEPLIENESGSDVS